MNFFGKPVSDRAGRAIDEPDAERVAAQAAIGELGLEIGGHVSTMAAVEHVSPRRPSFGVAVPPEPMTFGSSATLRGWPDR